METVSVNANEYHESFKCKNVNKKHKGLRMGASGMDFEDYSKMINSIIEIETFGSLLTEKQKAGTFTIKNNDMILREIENPTLHR